MSQALDEDGLTQLFEPYAPIELDLELPVLDTDAEGATEELFPAGPVELTARDMARLLLARVDGESELARLARTEALWKAVTARGQTATTTTLAPGASPATPADVAGFLDKVATGPNGVHLLRVQPSFDPSDPSAPELFQADVPYLRLLVASVMPGAVSPSNGNISFRVVNPLGDPNLTYRAVGRLAVVQANVVLVTETAGPAPATTSMVWHSPAGEVQSGAFAPCSAARPRWPATSGSTASTPPSCWGSTSRPSWPPRTPRSPPPPRRRPRWRRPPRPRPRLHDLEEHRHDDEEEGERLSERHDAGREWALIAARTADEKQGANTIIIDVGAVLAITDEFVITSGRNSRQVRTIAEEIEEAIKAAGGPGPMRVEGLSDLTWVLLDYGDIVVHVFAEETRRFYDIERLYRDCPTIAWQDSGHSARAHAPTSRSLQPVGWPDP